jgi:hypothetical protein
VTAENLSIRDIEPAGSCAWVLGSFCFQKMNYMLYFGNSVDGRIELGFHMTLDVGSQFEVESQVILLYAWSLELIMETQDLA